MILEYKLNIMELYIDKVENTCTFTIYYDKCTRWVIQLFNSDSWQDLE
jgi:hypothetical protein